jgi:uncharacterized protein
LVDAPASDLHKPLGAPKPKKAAPRWLRPLLSVAALLPVAALGGAALYVSLFGNADKAAPLAVAVIENPAGRPAATTPQFSFSAQEAAQAALEAAQRPESSAGQLEQEAGVRVMRPGGSDTPNSVIIRVPDATSVRLAAAPDRRLVDRTRLGVLPKTGEDGARSFQVYARPSPTGGPAQPRIAIVIGGLGISASTTADAIARLPGEISLAFAPYGADLERQVQRARGDGHEVFMQVPMEPFDYPDNDPGPHTLVTGPQATENADRFRWVLSRFTGYVGIVNFMGARFTSDEDTMTPVMREAAERGLMVVDDGSSGRSIMTQVASGFRTPAVRADLVLDLAARADAIDRELQRLEALAREKGFALASASALPLTIDRINRWARTLEARGIRLVPASAAAGARAITTGSIR